MSLTYKLLVTIGMAAFIFLMSVPLWNIMSFGDYAEVSRAAWVVMVGAVYLAYMKSVWSN